MSKVNSAVTTIPPFFFFPLACSQYTLFCSHLYSYYLIFSTITLASRHWLPFHHWCLCAAGRAVSASLPWFVHAYATYACMDWNMYVCVPEWIWSTYIYIYVFMYVSIHLCIHCVCAHGHFGCLHICSSLPAFLHVLVSFSLHCIVFAVQSNPWWRRQLRPSIPRSSALP